MKKIHTLTNIFLSFKIWKNRGSLFNQQEDELLCRVYLEISQDPIVSNNQALKQLMCTILYAVRNLKSCVIQVENMHLSGASEHDIMEKAKKLLVQDPKLKKVSNLIMCGF
ncbi:hypothetical protein Bca4012_072678 [Brassica carinata]